MKGKSVVAGNSPTAELSTFQTLLDAWAAAIAANDIGGILEFTEPDWQLIDPAAGPIPLARFLDVVRSGTLVHTAMSLEACSVLQVHDDVGVVIVHGTNTGSWQGNPFTAREWTTDVFVKHNDMRSEEHTSELQSRGHLVCRLLLDKKRVYKTHCR